MPWEYEINLAKMSRILNKLISMHFYSFTAGLWSYKVPHNCILQVVFCYIWFAHPDLSWLVIILT